jgi:large subunit ribosomal protein L20
LARTARSLHARKKRRKVLEQAKGYRGQKSRSYKKAKEQVWKSGVYAYEGRKQRKRDFRALWIQRINAASREHGLSYSQLVHGLKVAEVDLDRKILADLAITDPEAFGAIAAQARNALNGEPVQRRIELERKVAPAEEKPKKPRPKAKKAAPEPKRQKSDEVEATDAAERRAEELDVDLEAVEGSGAEGRVVVEDVEEAAEEEGKVHATEAAERKAEELGVDLSQVEGTGQNGRITVGDVQKAVKAKADNG